MDPNQDPTGVCFSGKSMPTLKMAVKFAAYEAITHLRFAVPYCSDRGYCHFPSRVVPGGAASFPGTRAERDPMLLRLVQYVIAQERLTQQMIDFLLTLAVQNCQIAICEPLRIDPARRVMRVLQPLTPEDKGYSTAGYMF